MLLCSRVERGPVAHEHDLDTDKRRDELARITNGYSPAMIEQVCSMALTIAHHNRRERFGWEDIVEAMTTSMNVEASGGSHFFHNLSGFRVGYFTVPLSGRARIDWPWLEAQPAARELRFVRHVRLAEPLTIRIDGRSRRGVIVHGD